MSATADSSFGELSEALQRNAKHEARLSNISNSPGASETMIRDSSLRSEWRRLRLCRASFARLRWSCLDCTADLGRRSTASQL